MSRIFQTQEFKTKSIQKVKKNPQEKNAWGIAIDTGYSGVKVFAPNGYYSFPSVAKRVPYSSSDNTIGELGNTDISYRDNAGSEYFIGAKAVNDIKATDANSSTAALYSRERYATPEYQIITRVGIGLGLLSNQYGERGDKPVYLMTGLPPAYLADDKEELIDTLAGQHDFFLKIGNDREWKHFSFELPKENIFVMAQPMGTLMAISTDRSGGVVASAKRYFSSNLLIFDPGFGTLDTFDISNHQVRSETSHTYDDLSMKRVFEEVGKELREKYDVSLPVFAMQRALSTGTVDKLDKKAHKSTKIDFSPILERCSARVCEEALRTIDGEYNYLSGYDYLVVTGGTGEAWLPLIKKYYEGMDGLTVIDGSMNDDIPAIFNNVRGYYMQLHSILKSK
ncbi:MAG: ParM/StbA family protein [Lachnospiraceae bacterium]|nr:ParM/StbA family protein [Lachnospiraceae bacterium]